MSLISDATFKDCFGIPGNPDPVEMPVFDKLYVTKSDISS